MPRFFSEDYAPHPDCLGARPLFPHVEVMPLPWELRYKIQSHLILSMVQKKMLSIYGFAHTLINLDLQVPQLVRNNDTGDIEENARIFRKMDRHLYKLLDCLSEYTDALGPFYIGKDVMRKIAEFDKQCWGYEPDNFVELFEIESLVQDYFTAAFGYE